jgi:hypothetical protein
MLYHHPSGGLILNSVISECMKLNKSNMDFSIHEQIRTIEREGLDNPCDVV